MIRDELRDQLTAAAKATGFARSIKLLTAQARECAYFSNATRRRAADDHPGATRLGGLPDLPKSAKWPAGINHQGQPSAHAAFLAQFNLADIPDLHDEPLPRRGMLWLFSQGVHHDGSFKFATLFDPHPKPSSLAPRKPPSKSNPPNALNARRPTPLRFTRGVSLPFHSKSFCEGLLNSVRGPHSDWTPLADALAPRNHAGQIGGYAIPVGDHDPYRVLALRQLARPDCIPAESWQSLAEYETYLKQSQLSPFPSPPFQPHFKQANQALRPCVQWIEEHATQIAAQADSWQLLVRFKRNLHARLDIGDAMTLDLFIPKSDLPTQNFDRLTGECEMVL